MNNWEALEGFDYPLGVRSIKMQYSTELEMTINDMVQ